MKALEFSNVSLSFGGIVAVDGVSFDIARGEVVCLLGPSGCGKTTTLRLAAGLEAPDTGSIAIAGRIAAGNGHNVPPEKRNLGLVFQDYALFPHLTVAENVGFALRHLPAQQRRERVQALLERVGLESHGGQYPYMLSGGEAQRVALVRALAPEPALMLLDEPFSNLDTRLRGDIGRETLLLLRDMGASVLLVTHDPEEAMRMADRIALMHKGKIVQIGSADELYARPQNGFVARFFGDINVLHAVIRRGRAETPFGTVPAPALPDGAMAEILFRPEALQAGIEASEKGLCLRGKVVSARRIGADCHIEMLIRDDVAPLRARIRDFGPPSAGEELALTVRPQNIFVFTR